MIDPRDCVHPGTVAWEDHRTMSIRRVCSCCKFEQEQNYLHPEEWHPPYPVWEITPIEHFINNL